MKIVFSKTKKRRYLVAEEIICRLFGTKRFKRQYISNSGLKRSANSLNLFKSISLQYLFCDLSLKKQKKI
jgi:hypothetical protein